MKKKFRVLAPFVIFIALTGLATAMITNRPEANRRPPAQAPLMAVEVQTIVPRDYPVVLGSYGSVQPSISSQLVAQVSGQVVWVSPSLRDGGFFAAGEPLMRLDRRDYEADLKIAEAQLIEARRELVEAKARAEQALRDWRKLGRTDEPSDLVLQKPQLLAAEARVVSSESALQKAQLAYERTEIAAPFAGRVLNQRADLGQVVTPGMALAEVYATDAVEIRLPLRNRDLAFFELPEMRQPGAPPERGDVVIESRLGQATEWVGSVVRTEGAIDDAARQLHVIARIEDPFGENLQHERPLKIGEYVGARLAGRVVPDAVVIPNSAIYQGSYVYRVEQDVLRRTDVEILWQNDEEAMVGRGLEFGDQLVLTPLGQVTSGMRVAIEEGASPENDRPVDRLPTDSVVDGEETRDKAEMDRRISQR